MATKCERKETCSAAFAFPSLSSLTPSCSRKSSFFFTEHFERPPRACRRHAAAPPRHGALPAATGPPGAAPSTHSQKSSAEPFLSGETSHRWQMAILSPLADVGQEPQPLYRLV